MTTAEHITPDLEQALAGTGLVLEDVTVTPAGKRRVVKVLLDRDLGRVGLAGLLLPLGHAPTLGGRRPPGSMQREAVVIKAGQVQRVRARAATLCP